MDRIDAARARLNQATDVPGILGAAYEAFEDMLPVIRSQQDPAVGAFVAFVMSAAFAANGRDAVAAAPSLPPTAPGTAPRADDDQPDAVPALEAATALSKLSGLLVCRLTDAAFWARTSADKEACAEGARQASRIWVLLRETAGPRPAEPPSGTSRPRPAHTWTKSQPRSPADAGQPPGPPNWRSSPAA